MFGIFNKSKMFCIAKPDISRYQAFPQWGVGKGKRSGQTFKNLLSLPLYLENLFSSYWEYYLFNHNISVKVYLTNAKYEVTMKRGLL